MGVQVSVYNDTPLIASGDVRSHKQHHTTPQIRHITQTRQTTQKTWQTTHKLERLTKRHKRVVRFCWLKLFVMVVVSYRFSPLHEAMRVWMAGNSSYIRETNLPRHVCTDCTKYNLSFWILLWWVMVVIVLVFCVTWWIGGNQKADRYMLKVTVKGPNGEEKHANRRLGVIP